MTRTPERPRFREADLPPGASAVFEIDAVALRANYQALRARHPRGAVAAVVKANAYGSGIEVIAPVLHQAGCSRFFTAHLSEALTLRRLLPEAWIAVLNGLPPRAAEVFIEARLLPVLGSLAEIAAWRAAAARAGRRLPAILHLDTGMARLGLAASEVARLAEDPALLAGIEVVLVMSHLMAAERPDDPLNEAQRRRFVELAERLPPAPRSLANSSGVFLGPAYAFDLARTGAGLYGINPVPAHPNPLRFIGRLWARVLQVREIASGQPVGYDASWRASRPSRIATLGLGYADGFPYRLANRGVLHFDERPVPLVGRVSMDLITCDVTDHPEVSPGAWLEAMGPALPPETLAALAGTSPYEILTSLGGRIVRCIRPEE
jgi:alanine racemase